MIVIDIGCARYGGDYSIERLIEEFHPDEVYGFDPNAIADMLHLNIGKLDPETFELLPPEGPNIHIQRTAAWVYDGEIGFLSDGLNSCLTYREDVPQVPCFDLAKFIAGLPVGEEIVLKMDAEGSEYDLLDHLIATRTDALLKLAWVEWHPKRIVNAAQRRKTIEDRIACELVEWLW